ncbi:RNA-directed DNA polymerase [Oricola indica]|jgi:hypothetical protein|uniref:RNA-directed DNA polymerase n=1 Tax=Oricola indica TaxID=2872591 RepID=UPI001CBAFE10|nr:RNA-directed DNA polymerase [Oricola indica]
MFPEELPPPFVTYKLARYRESILACWNPLQAPKPFNFESYSYPRLGRQRRRLAVVNPIPQTLLCDLISRNWQEIYKHISTSQVSLDTPTILDDAERAVPKPDFDFIALKRLDVGSTYNHILLSDISRFYGTIYTHVIPWALHGKDWCKANLHTQALANSLGEKLDRHLRKGQDNQTLGIPVGPDTSRIISEIVAVSIEKGFLASEGVTAEQVFRYVDDWFIGYDTAGEAEDAIAFLSSSSLKFELELNHEKTRIIEPMDSLQELWPSDIRSTVVRNTVKSQAYDLQTFFTKAFNYSTNYPNENVLFYAIKLARSFTIRNENTEIFENYLLRAARANQTTIPIVTQILATNHQRPEASQQKIRKFIHDTIQRCAPVGFHGEIAWVLFLAKSLEITIEEATINLVSKLESSVCALLTLDLRNKGLIKGNVDTAFWSSFMNPDSLHSSMWLLAYEADLKNWLPSPLNHVSNHTHFSVLKSKNVEFYDSSKLIESKEESVAREFKVVNRKIEKSRLKNILYYLSQRSI